MIAPLLLLLAAAAEPSAVKSEAEHWALVRSVDSAAAYELYLRRFPAGPHAAEATAAADRLRDAGRRAADGVEARAPEPPPPAVPPGGALAGPCTELLWREPESAQTRAFAAARRLNTPAALGAFAGGFAGSACGSAVGRFLAARAALRLHFVPVPGLGPLPPHRLRYKIFTQDDYPAAAIRNRERGTVSVEWDVAEDGYAESCRIVRSSGSARLDEATCGIVVRRMIHDPARDAAGNVVRATDRLSIEWDFPNRPPPEPRPTH